MAQNALGAWWLQTRSTARTTAPAARLAAISVPGDMAVSESSRKVPVSGRLISRYSR